MFKNINKILSSGSSRICFNNYKMINGSVRTFSSSMPHEKSFSPLVKALTCSGLIVGVGYILNNPTELLTTKSTEHQECEKFLCPDVKEHLKKVYGYSALNAGITGLVSYYASKTIIGKIIVGMDMKYTFLVSWICAYFTTCALDVNKDSFAKHTALITTNILNGLYIASYIEHDNIFSIVAKIKKMLPTASLLVALSYVSVTSKRGKDGWIDKLFNIGMPVGLLSFMISSMLPNEKKSVYGMKMSAFVIAYIYISYYTKNMIRNVETHKDLSMNGGVIKKLDHINDSLVLNIFAGAIYRL